MSEFIKIKPTRGMLTGSLFQIKSSGNNTGATITCTSNDSLFTTELKEGDIVCFYNYYYDRNPIKVEYTVSSISSVTVFTAVEMATKDLKPDLNGILYHYAIKKLDTKYNKYEDKRVLTSSITGYKKDPNLPGLVLLDVDESLIDSKEYNLTSVNTGVEFGGTSANQKYIKVFGHYTGKNETDYKVQIQTIGVKDVRTVTCVADSAGSLDSKAFYFNTPNTRYAVKIIVRTADNASIDGNYRGGRGIGGNFDRVFLVYIDAGTSAANIATAVYNELIKTATDVDGEDRPKSFDFTVSNLSGATFRINCSSKGLVTAPGNISPEMTSRSNGISFKTIDGISTITDTNYESDGLGSVTWVEGDTLYIENSEKNDGEFKLDTISGGTITSKMDNFVDEDAGRDVIIRNRDFAGSAGFSFAATTTGVNDKFKWSDTNGDVWNEESVTIKGMHYLNNGVRVRLNHVDYTVDDYWTFSFPKPTMIKSENTIEELDNIYKCTNLC